MQKQILSVTNGVTSAGTDENHCITSWSLLILSEVEVTVPTELRPDLSLGTQFRENEKSFKIFIL